VIELDAGWNRISEQKLVSLRSVPSRQFSMNKLVVEDRSRKFVLLRFVVVLAWLVLRVLHACDSPLAQDFAVLLAGDFLGHLEHHLDQGVFRKLLGSK